MVWQADLPDISGTHLHPVDMRGAIVSLDRADPPGSWRWGGPAWTGRVGTGAPGRILGAAIGVDDPDQVADRWAAVLGVEANGSVVQVDGGELAFAPCPSRRDEGLTDIGVQVPEMIRRGRESVEIGGVRFAFFDDA